MVQPHEVSIFRLLAPLAAFLVVGGPAAYFLWHSLSDLLYGRIHEVSIPGLIGGGVVFTAVLWTLGRWVRRQAI
jgi:hypothetical protein